jgi:hypothetical protein
MHAIGNKRSRCVFLVADALFNRSGECPHAATFAITHSPMMFRMPSGFTIGEPQ